MSCCVINYKLLVGLEMAFTTVDKTSPCISSVKPTSLYNVSDREFLTFISCLSSSHTSIACLYPKLRLNPSWPRTRTARDSIHLLFHMAIPCCRTVQIPWLSRSVLTRTGPRQHQLFRFPCRCSFVSTTVHVPARVFRFNPIPPILCQYSRTSENWLNNTNFLIKYSEGYWPISPKLWKPISRKH